MSPQTPLADAKRQAAIDHILTAARRLVLRSGLDVTMDELAEASGVSRRTLFRHFATRDKLLAAAFIVGITDYRSRLPHYAGDLPGWLRETCETAHRMNATIGPGFFELSSRSDLPADLAAAEQRRRDELRGAMQDVTTTLWQSSGGTGDPPNALTATVAAHLSPYFTAALTVDAEQSWSAAAELAHNAIRAALAAALPRT